MQNVERSELELQREHADLTHDIGSSLESTDESVHDSDSEYDADEILAQRVYDEAENANDPVVQFLVKYTDYPLHRSTWEPKSNLRPTLFDSWKEKANTMGKGQREEHGRKNCLLFNKAFEKAEAAKEVRRDKRAEARMKKQKEREKKEKEKRFNKKGVARPKPSATRTQRTSNTTKTTGSTLSKRARTVATSSDDEYSGSSSFDDEASSDDEPLIKTRTVKTVRPAQQEPEASAKPPKRPCPAMSRRKTLPDVFIKVPERKSTHPKQPKTPNGTSSTDDPEKRVEQPASVASKKDPAAETNSVAPERRKSLPTGPAFDPLKPDVYAPRDPGPIRMVNQAKQSSRAAWNTQNKQFATLQFRRVAEKRGRMEGTPDFNQLDFVNGTPAGTSNPAGNSSDAQGGGDHNGHREPTQMHVQERQEARPGAVKASAPLQPYEVNKVQVICWNWKFGTCSYTARDCRFLHREFDPAGNELPLGRWDMAILPKHKTPPETCWFWFSEGRCKNTADECNYAHENTGHLFCADTSSLIHIDPNILPGSAEAKRIVRQNKRPGITCWFWLKSPKGCTNGDDCRFAHVNTGILANRDGEPTQIDKNEVPVRCELPFQREVPGKREVPFHYALPKFARPPLTCFFWLRGNRGCDKPDDVCHWAHWNTGYLPQNGRPPVQIDPRENPKTAPPEHREKVPLELPYSNRSVDFREKTCFFWNEGGCNQKTGKCRRQHCYTGVVADPPPNWKPPFGWKQRLRDEPDHRPEPDHRHEPDRMQIDHIASAVTDHPGPSNVQQRDHCHEPDRMQIDHVPSPVTDHHRPSSVRERDNEASDQLNRELEDEYVDLIQPAVMKSMLETVNFLDFEEMFSCNGGRKGDILAGRNAFVLYHPTTHMVQHEHITRWLLLNHVDVFNGHHGIPAAWDMFKKLILSGESGIIIAHPDFEGYASLPGFGDVLRGTVRLWSIGYQEPPNYNIWHPKTHHLEFSRQEIFPHGGIIYITDDVFLQTPHLALRIFDHFFAMIEASRRVDSGYLQENVKVNDGLLLWRIGVRPEFMQWIGDTVLEHQAKSAIPDANIAALESLYELLASTSYIDPDPSLFSPSNPRPPEHRRLDFYPIISAREDLARQIDLYYDAKAVSQHEANTDMVRHYSGLGVVERRLYRQFFVVHMDAVGVGAQWKETFANIDEVMTGERCVEYFECGAEGNRFENWTWMFEERGEDSGVEVEEGEVWRGGPIVA